MKHIKSKKRAITLSLVFSVLTFSLVPSFLSAQDGPVRFQYGGDMKAKMEDENFYLYVYCNKYEGSTCTSGDGAVRIYIPNPGQWLRALIK
ncbi:MAG: hypothetical protein HWE07_08020 [Cytophagia bacterium]|nr:hypothetical protein [Cytophagia bacterium]